MTQPIPPEFSEDPAIFRYLAANRHLAQTLTSVLPPPPDDTPEARLHRDTAAIAAVAALLPANPAEVAVAVSHVAANAHAMECMRMAQTPDTRPELTLRCLSQSTSMLRQALAALRALQRMQAIRARREARPEQADAAARIEHIVAAGLTGDAIAAAVTPEASDAAARPEDPEPGDDLAQALESYVHIYPQRAALIRRHGGVPDDIRFGPPDPAIVEALVSGTSPLLRALDAVIAEDKNDTKDSKSSI